MVALILSHPNGRARCAPRMLDFHPRNRAKTRLPRPLRQRVRPTTFLARQHCKKLEWF